MEYRRLTPDDATEFRKLRIESLQFDPDYFRPTPEEASKKPLSDFVEQIQLECVIGAVVAMKLVGFVSLKLGTLEKFRHAGFVGPLFVHPAFRRRGAGERLMIEIEEFARKSRLEHLSLNVVHTNEGAIRLYRRLGYLTFGSYPHAYKVASRFLDLNQMVKFLEYS